jgi:MFS transporter, PAT family, beta-lactamase induction signal transducer AmpG
MSDTSPAAAAQPNLLQSLAIYLRPRLLGVGAMGIASGFGFTLVAATLTTWLSELEISRKSIGLFAWVLLVFSFKPLWAWMVDSIRIPILTKLIGHRRSWLLVADIILIIAIVLLATSDPANNVEWTAICAIFVAFAAATQDIVIDAYRIEILKPEEMAAGAGMSQYGWRTGAFVTSAGVLVAATYFGWPVAYLLTIVMIAFGFGAAFLLGEPKAHAAAVQREQPKGSVYDLVLRPFAEFLTRPAAWAILLFILVHKIGDTMANLMLRNLFVTLEFTKKEIALYDVSVGQVALLIGIFLGGLAYARFGTAKTMFISLILMMVSNLSFAGLAVIGHSNLALAAAMGFENFASGVGGVVVVAYLSSLCNLAFTASQYALFSAAAAILGRFLSGFSGFVIDAIGYPLFYVVTTLAALPGILLFAYLWRAGFVTELPQEAKTR